MRPSKVLVAAILLIIGSVAVSVQGPWTTPPGSNGKVRIVSTAADALCVGGSAVAPASNACTGGVYSGPAIFNGSAIASGSTWTYVTTTATGTQNDFNPGIVGNTVIRANNASALTITGFASTVAQVSGQMVLVEGINAQVNFRHQATSTAANQLFNIATSGDTPILLGYVLYVYDGTTQRWRLTAHDQGQWITPTFAAGNYVGNGTQTWTLASGDVTTNKYWLRGRSLTWALSLNTTSVGGGANTQLRATIPGGFTSAAAGRSYFPTRVSDNGAAAATSLAYSQQGVTYVEFYTTVAASANWASATDTTTVEASIFLEVQ